MRPRPALCHPSAAGSYVFLTQMVPGDSGNNGYREDRSPASDTLTVTALTATTTTIAAPTVTYGQDLVITVTVSPNTGSNIPTGSVTLTVASTGGYGVFKEQSVAIAGLSGLQDIYLTFSGGSGVGNIDYFKLY